MIMKRKFINVTKKYIEDLAPTDFCVELIQPAWEKLFSKLLSEVLNFSKIFSSL